MSAPGRSSIAQKYLDPATSLAEVLFGLIMTLTFTLAAGVIMEEEGREGARELLIALIGCNIAWGIIDGALYIAGEFFGRGRLRNVGRIVREEADDRAALALVAAEYDETLEPVTTEAERSDLYRRIVANVRSTPPGTSGITKADVMGALASFWLVFLASLPAALPFLFIDDARLALRVSNAILVAFLFLTGYHWARYTLGKPWLIGLCFMIVGIGLVAVAIALGG